MGTDVIKLNDREYMLSLQSRLMKEYENVMDKQVSEIVLMLDKRHQIHVAITFINCIY